MPPRRLALAGVLAVVLGAGTVPAASHAVAVGSAKQCTSTSKTGTKPSKYNRTPKGGGPWTVPLDPCNTEGQGASGTPYYNCAYWAAEKRPDVWVDAVWVYGYSSKHPGAWRIAVDAKKADFPVDHKPQAGDIAGWGRNVKMGSSADGTVYYAGAGGHVAYVEKVLSKHRISISEMGHDPSDGGYTHTISYNRHGTQFIHQRS